ncbi:hypothetical protein OY671_010010, partial [Metschnikowia pulcherrima]
GAMTSRLHGYWRSTASYRVRIASASKGVGHEQVTHDLRTGAQRAPAFLALNSQGSVPASEIGAEGEGEAAVLTQSPAILEWSDEVYPQTPSSPGDASGRATVRAMAGSVCCDIHPSNNSRVSQASRQDFQASDAQVSAWIARWIGTGFDASEASIARHGGYFTFGDAATMADCCSIPQVYSAQRFG